LEFDIMLTNGPPSGPRKALVLLTAACLTTISSAALADDPYPTQNGGFDMSVKDGAVHAPRADAHAPIGVMADHRHRQGELMLSYRYMGMWMEGNLIGDNNVSPDKIATTVPNRFFGAPGQPPTLRVVPTEMNTDMHMFGGMYGVTDKVTLMAMLPYITKDMHHITYQGGMGTTRLGTFETKTDGIGDASLTALIGLYDTKTAQGSQHLNLLLGMSAPTGSIDEEGRILTPMALRPVVRLPYAMQLGSGTWDLLPGVVYTARSGNISYGGQYRGWIRLEDENDEGYSLGDLHQGALWAQYEWAPWISNSIRVAARTQDSIHGIDLNISGPVQTANPDFYGGERVDLLFGVNLVGQRGVICGQRLAAEVGVPVYQDLNGPQLKSDWTFMLGWQKALGDC
jgi:hypothetical protein